MLQQGMRRAKLSLKGQRKNGEYDPIRALATALLLHSVSEANRGVMQERAWLIHEPMAELCFDVLGMNPQMVREALAARWQVCRPEGVSSTGG